jgi:hypothetical protein
LITNKTGDWLAFEVAPNVRIETSSRRLNWV